MSKAFLKHIALFFLSVVLGYLIIEYYTRQLPLGYTNISTQLEKEQSNIEILILGSSQIKNAINPEWLDQPAISLTSGNQHHDTDFKLLKGVLSRLNSLETVVLEISYNHFELPHNGSRFWKNSIYYNYYNVNAFERTAYFKDRLIYLSNPSFFSERLTETYIHNVQNTGFNSFGFDTLNYEGRFKKLQYNEAAIAKTNFRINEEENKALFAQNAALLQEMLLFLKEQNLRVVICQTPMYRSYLPRRNSNILHRRDSLIAAIKGQSPGIIFLNKEEDTLTYNVKDYWNQSHLNPRGAAKFTAQLNHLLSKVN